MINVQTMMHCYTFNYNARADCPAKTSRWAPPLSVQSVQYTYGGILHHHRLFVFEKRKQGL